jgi:hypothetical protein
MIQNPKIYNNTDWVRPADWLPIDHLVDTSSQKIVMLFAVYDDEMNAIAINKSLGTIIDWGDGNITDNSAGRAEHIYTYSDIPDSTLCSRGYRQVIITMYNDIGYNLLTIGLQKPLTLIVMPNMYPVRIIDMKLHVPYLTSWTSGGSSYCKMCMLERIIWIGLTGYTTSTIVFWRMHRLQYLYMEDYTKISHFESCVLLPMKYKQEYTNMPMLNRFQWHQYIDKYIRTEESTTTDYTAAFNFCLGLDYVEINMKNAVTLTNMCASAHNLKTVILTNCESVTTTTTMFKLCYNITKLILQGIIVSFACTAASLSANALNSLFTSLGTPTTTQTINVSGNPGAATCDTSIATAKNWTVITA